MSDNTITTATIYDHNDTAITIELRTVGLDRFGWFETETDADTEVYAATIKDALVAASSAWGQWSIQFADDSYAQMAGRMVHEDGLRWEDEHGNSLADLLLDWAHREQIGHDSVRFVFSDDSTIIEAGPAWDYAAECGVCWQGAGCQCAERAALLDD